MSARISQLSTSACAALLLCAAGLPARAGEVAAVLSSGSGAYTEAYDAFSRAFQGQTDLVDASAVPAALPVDVRYVAAFGARAVALAYPAGTHRVYALAPLPSRAQDWHEISMLPEPAAALAAFKELQPGLARLAVFWSSYPGDKYMAALRKQGQVSGVDIVPARLSSPDQFPQRLRSLMGEMDAFWLMPDPVLITQNSLMILAAFACSNSVPFYAPTHALLRNGATAVLAPNFADAGTAAARAVAVLRAGGKLPPVIYADSQPLSVNFDQAEKCRWPLRGR